MNVKPLGSTAPAATETAGSPASTDAIRSDGWWVQRWAGPQVIAGISRRDMDRARLLAGLRIPVVAVEAEQVHGASVAAIERGQAPPAPIAGCDALLTSVPGVALLIRTADCLPIFYADPVRGVVGLAHAGWRGLAAQLPARVVSALRHGYQSRPEAVRVAIGPAIRACCYEVGPEFTARFDGFIHERGGQRTCDLVGVTVNQLCLAGIRREHIVDCGRCTACETTQWFSLRREGPQTGRMTSLIVLRP